MATAIRCPQCKKEIRWSSEFPQRPFCSLRCQEIDLGAWASDAYAIEGAAPASPEEAETFRNTDTP